MCMSLSPQLRMQLWRNQFVHLALIWLEVLSKQVTQWVLAAIKEDQVGGEQLKSSTTGVGVRDVH